MAQVRSVEIIQDKYPTIAQLSKIFFDMTFVTYHLETEHETLSTSQLYFHSSESYSSQSLRLPGI